MQQAEQQLSPLFQQQTQALQSQIPAIQQLYDTLTQGQRQQTQQQLQTGTQDIVEDASRRGVLRSTLPVDARQELQTSLQQSLSENLGQLSAEQASQVGDIRSRIADVGVQRGTAIQDLASTLRQQDMEREQLELQRQQLQQPSRSAQSTQPDGPQLQQQAFQALAESWRPGRDGYVSPQQWNSFRSEWVQAGFDPKSFDAAFAHLVNPAHQREARSDLTRYAGMPVN